MDDLPSNSQSRPTSRAAKTPEPVEKKVEQVISSSVTRRKRPLSKRVKETFFGAERGVTETLVNDVIVPGVKDTLADVVVQAVERTLFGESRSASRRSGGGRSHTPYNRYSTGSTERMFGGKPDPRSATGATRRGRAMHDFQEIVLNSRAEAEEVLDRLVGHCEEYDGVTVAVLYQMLGEKPNFVDHKWGWTDLRDARTSRVRGGYLLDIPAPEQID